MRINFGSFGLLVQFGFRIMCQERIWEVYILGFFWSKSSNLEVQKIWGMDVDIAISILMKCSLLYGGLSGNIQFLKNFTWFLGGAIVGVERSFFLTKFFKKDIGQLFWLYMDIVKQCVKVPSGQICSIWVCTK